MNLDTFFSRHDKVALMFSGGKDSIACMYLLKPYLDKVTLVWVNRGADLPEITSYMESIRAQVPNFLEVITDQPKNVEMFGHPADVVPISYTPIGQLCTSSKPIKFRSYMDCCADNFWNPAEAKIREMGFTGVVRGQRNSDTHKSPVSSGHIWNGVEYVFPINDWSTEDVLTYIQKCGEEITERLLMSHSSLDCWDCTAYLGENKDRMKYLKKHYPNNYEHVVYILKQLNGALAADMAGLHSALES